MCPSYKLQGGHIVGGQQEVSKQPTEYFYEILDCYGAAKAFMIY